MNIYEFPAEAITILRKTVWDPVAELYFDGMSGGLFWGDEFPAEAIDACTSKDNWAHRVIIAFRASLIDGQPREELRHCWDQLLRECPNWPGFRPERCSNDLKDRQHRDNKRFMRSLEVISRGKRNSAIDQPGAGENES